MSHPSRKPMLLATSLVPGRDEDRQRKNVESWTALGFEVMSVNGAAETDAVRNAFPGIEVIVAEKTAERIAHKPVPHIHDLLKALRHKATKLDPSGESVLAGIINSDIYLRSLPSFVCAVDTEPPGTMILGPRVDVENDAQFDAYQPTGSETYSVGYDYFLMSGDMLGDFADSPFAMGMPFWDYWMPLVALLNGRKLKSINSPVALHVKHDTQWDDTIYLYFHSLVAYVIELCRKSVGQNESAQARQFDFLFDVLSHLYGRAFAQGTTPGKTSTAPDQNGIAALADFYDRFQEVAVHHIKSRSTSLTVPEA